MWTSSDPGIMNLAIFGLEAEFFIRNMADAGYTSRAALSTGDTRTRVAHTAIT
jgi:hypothetical protein